MYSKHVICSCGKEFYCQSINQSFGCIYCGTQHMLDEVVEEETIEEETIEEE